MLNKSELFSHNINSVTVTLEIEAVRVVDRVSQLITMYGYATVADFFESVGLSTNYKDDKYGWKDMTGIHIVKVNDGFQVNLPKPEDLTDAQN